MNRFLPFLFFLFSITIFSQENDTIYIYEEVIEYDTVYVKKPNVVVDPTDQRPGRRKRKFRRQTDFAFSIYGGSKQINVFRDDDSSSQRGIGVGINVRRTAFVPEMSVSLGVQFFKWPGNKTLNAVKAETIVDGLYFSNFSKPPQLKAFSNEHNEIILPLNFYYTWKNFSPYLGFFLNYTSFKMQYEIQPRSGPLKYYDFAANQYNFGYVTGLIFQQNRFGISLEYQHHEFLNMHFWNRTVGNIDMKFKNGFQDHKLLLGIHLSLVP